MGAVWTERGWERSKTKVEGTFGGVVASRRCVDDVFEKKCNVVGTVGGRLLMYGPGKGSFKEMRYDEENGGCAVAEEAPTLAGVRRSESKEAKRALSVLRDTHQGRPTVGTAHWLPGGRLTRRGVQGFVRERRVLVSVAGLVRYQPDCPVPSSELVMRLPGKGVWQDSVCLALPWSPLVSHLAGLAAPGDCCITPNWLAGLWYQKQRLPLRVVRSAPKRNLPTV